MLGRWSIMEASHRSELEYLIMSFISEGVGSGYAMRLQMNHMDGLRWSAESGSVYRVLRRLVSQGLIVEAGKAGSPNRERTEHALTPAGRSALDAWARSPMATHELTALIDPLRLKIRCFGRLDASERRAAVTTWIDQNRGVIRLLRRRCRTSSSPMLAESNLLMLAKARHAWLKSIQKSLANG